MFQIRQRSNVGLQSRSSTLREKTFFRKHSHFHGHPWSAVKNEVLELLGASVGCVIDQFRVRTLSDDFELV